MMNESLCFEEAYFLYYLYSLYYIHFMMAKSIIVYSQLLKEKRKLQKKKDFRRFF